MNAEVDFQYDLYVYTSALIVSVHEGTFVWL